MKSSSRSAVGRVCLVAVVGNLDAAHQFHDEERPPVFRRAGVEDLRDVRMIHHRERLTLLLEARDDFLRVHPHLDDLQRHRAPHRLLLLRHPDHAKAAFADLLEQLVRPDPLARLLRFEPRQFRFHLGRERWPRLQEFARALVRTEQRENLRL